MTSCLISVALVLTPAPMSAPKETTWVSTSVPAAGTVEFSPTTFVSFIETLDVPESSSAATEKPAAIEEPTPPEPEPPPMTPIEAGMNRLAELGATPWQLRTFGCLAWYESRNNPYAVSPTQDFGLWQINRRFHAWRWAGRDIFDPVVNAEVAWDIYRESGWRAWMTARLCGV